MKFAKSILSIFLAMMVFFASNGIVHEYYYCTDCQEEHHEISLFEFGEISHNHKCASHNHYHHLPNHNH
ncbi:MAG: hypothetical protein HUK15_07880, partial [Bacteroidales bacterium]|nr:hypothetical protein [Bacteroidales bacterium]